MNRIYRVDMIWCLPGIFHSDGFLYNSHCPYFILHTASPLVPRPGATKIPENQFDVSTIAAYPYQGQGTPSPPGPLANGAQWPAQQVTSREHHNITNPNIYLSCVDIYTYLHISIATLRQVPDFPAPPEPSS